MAEQGRRARKTARLPVRCSPVRVALCAIIPAEAVPNRQGKQVTSWIRRHCCRKSWRRHLRQPRLLSLHQQQRPHLCLRAKRAGSTMMHGMLSRPNSNQPRKHLPLLFNRPRQHQPHRLHLLLLPSQRPRLSLLVCKSCPCCPNLYNPRRLPALRLSRRRSSLNHRPKRRLLHKPLNRPERHPGSSRLSRSSKPGFRTVSYSSTRVLHNNKRAMPDKDLSRLKRPRVKVA